MKSGNYGWKSAIKSVNTDSDKKWSITDLKNIIKQVYEENIFVPVRVVDIILDDNHPKFNSFGGWSSLGVIFYTPVLSPIVNNIFPFAYPLDTNVKNFPLINEIVYVSFLSSKNIGEINTSTKLYYTTKLNLWNHPHHNAYPLDSTQTSPTQDKSYLQTQAGSTSIVSNTPIQINLGKTFIERSDIHPLLPFEGDIIYEGRWGNSIRFGSTVKNSSNNWSNIGSDGDPITIIRNGQGFQSEEGWIPIIENINDNDSSIYLTSTQNIPVNVARQDYTSYSGSNYNPPSSPKEYSGNQIILNSGRLIFNASSDHILLSAGKSINLNTPESINIDTRKVLIQSDFIYLGTNSLANEPLLLGNITVNLLKNLVSSLLDLTNTLKTLTSDPVAPNSPATFTELNIKSIGISAVLQSMLKELGTTPDDCKLTSKRNFTL